MAPLLSRHFPPSFVTLVFTGIVIALPVPAQESTSIESSRAFVNARRGPVSAEEYLSKAPPEVSPEERRIALEHTHVPAPPLTVDPSIDPASIKPRSPATVPGFASDPLTRGAGAFTFLVNEDLGGGAPSNSTSQINEPSVGNSGDVVFYSGNWYAALSSDGGNSFTYVNPYTGPFGAVNNGFCCDQIVIYDPGHDAMFYLQQYIADGTSGTQRINVDQGADGTFECAYDFTPQILGLPAGRWLDFPDLVLGSGFLYHTSNVIPFGGNFASEAMISRYPLNDISSCVGNLGFNFLTVSDRFSFRATHGAGTTIYWGAHNSTTSIRIYRWQESSGTIFSDDVAIGAWNAGTQTCPDADGRDFCARADPRVQGAYLADSVIGFMWNAAQGGGFPYPQVQVARFNESDRSLINQTQIWNANHAWLYPSVGVNVRDDLGGTILAGGGALYPVCLAWLADDVNGGVFAPLENYVSGASDEGPVGNVSGDYLSTRPHSPFASTWIGSCFSLVGGGNDSNARPRFLWFAREGDNPLCADSFSLACGSADSWANNFSGNTDRVTGYSCNSFDYSGPEYSYAFGVSSSTQVTVDLTGLTADLDLLVVRDSGSGCNPINCVADSTQFGTADESLTFAASPGEVFHIVVDGFSGAVSPYDITVSCDFTIFADGFESGDTSAWSLTVP